ncbi:MULTISPECIES: thioredoxin [unclassified Haladaptatus]|uniref:thioredoxin n=1 Tax=unclassified Haladaptatus TaxID=2622732 RepID=UPI00209BBCD5|nr:MULTISPECIES: thioredoxin [unclassified Haladaptatus]MCO8245370.1 thioredoxin [Haladaptatus sp. AB643]MCO8256807.1 thioredoxin [Haladaptatus sp. AB618]
MTTETTEAGSKVPTEPIHIDGQVDLETTVADNDVVLTDFYADWCGPCQMLEPVVETIAAETEAVVAKVDVDTNQQLAGAYGVRGVPTLVLFADGDQVEEVVGVRGEDQLRGLIEGYTE